MNWVMWLARDKNGTLYCYSKKPYKGLELFVSPYPMEFYKLPDEVFKDVIFDNSPVFIDCDYCLFVYFLKSLNVSCPI